MRAGANRTSSIGGWLASVMPGSRAEPPAGFASALLEHLADGVVACDAEGNFVLVNRRAREGSETFPATVAIPANLPQERWAEYFQLYRPGGADLLATDELPLVRALRGETVRDMRLETRAESGARAVIDVSGGPVLDADGEIQGAVVVLRDCTAQVETEARLELSSTIAANIALGVCMVSATDGTIVFTNTQWARLFGYETGELVGSHISVVNAPTDVSPEERAQEIFGALEQDGLWEGEFHNLRKDGSLVWTHANIASFEHPMHGAVWITASSDITARKEGEAALQEAAERFRTAFEEAPVGIALVGTDQKLIDANRCLCELVGWRRDELVGRALAAIEHPDDHALDAHLAAQVFNGELPRYRIAKRYLTRAGEVVPVTLTSTVVRAPEGRPLHSVLVVDERS